MKSLRSYLVLAGGLALAGLACTKENTQPGKRGAADFELDTSFTHTDLRMAEGYSFQVIFQEGDSVRTPAGGWAEAYGDHDFMAFLPDPNDPARALLWVNHESVTQHDLLGDGGGASVVPLVKEGNAWVAEDAPLAMDFAPVGGTYNNCLGAVTPWGTVLTSEETEPWSNADLWRKGKGFRDTSAVNGRPRYLQYGWMVEVDPWEGKALTKHTGMGRFSHEGALCMADQKTVYLLDDYAPGVFFKYVAATAGDYSDGQLFAYRQGADGNGGSWLPMPMDRSSLENARNVALGLGATIFIRLEDIEEGPGGLLYMTETGKDHIQLGDAIQRGGRLAEHLKRFDNEAHTLDDMYGRILTFDPNTQQIRVWLEGGQATGDSTKVLSNPDNLSIDRKRNRLMIHEDINAASRGRVPAHAEGVLYNEVYYISLASSAPVLDELVRIAISPPGSETTGPVWAPDYGTYFFNFQDPDASNPAPWNRSGTVMIRLPE